VPVEFAHGLCTPEPDTEVTYEVTNSYSAEHGYGIRRDAPDLRTPWRFRGDQIVLSEKDRNHPFSKDARYLF
jgi:dTDP-4-dehydrorhamnose 3,5-epimerase